MLCNYLDFLLYSRCCIYPLQGIPHQGIPHVAVYIDDIIITGRMASEHLWNLEEVRRSVDTNRMRLKRSKCKVMMAEVEYLGHRTSRKGCNHQRRKSGPVEIRTPVPTTTTQLKSFLVLINFYGKFLPNLSTTLAPLHQLLEKKTPWTWGTSQQQLTVPPGASLHNPLKPQTTNAPINFSQARAIPQMASARIQRWALILNAYDHVISYRPGTFLNRKDELSVQDGCLLWGAWVVVPPPGCTRVLEMLHETHPGISRIKALARSYVW